MCSATAISLMFVTVVAVRWWGLSDHLCYIYIPTYLHSVATCLILVKHCILLGLYHDSHNIEQNAILYVILHYSQPPLGHSALDAHLPI